MDKLKQQLFVVMTFWFVLLLSEQPAELDLIYELALIYQAYEYGGSTSMNKTMLYYSAVNSSYHDWPIMAIYFLS